MNASEMKQLKKMKKEWEEMVKGSEGVVEREKILGMGFWGDGGVTMAYD